MRRHDYENHADLLSGAGRFYYGIGDFDISLLDAVDVDMMEGLATLMFDRLRKQFAPPLVPQTPTSGEVEG